jgi:hypothetical protein
MKIKISVVGIIRIVFGLLSVYTIYGFITTFNQNYMFYVLSMRNIDFFIRWATNYIPFFYIFSLSVYEIIKLVKANKNDKSN